MLHCFAVPVSYMLSRIDHPAGEHRPEDPCGYDGDHNHGSFPPVPSAVFRLTPVYTQIKQRVAVINSEFIIQNSSFIGYPL